MAGPCEAALPVRELCKLAGSAVGAAVEGTFGAVARAIAEAGEAVLREVTTAWTRVPSGSLTNTEAIRLLQGDLRVVTALVAVLGLMAAAAKMAMTRRGEDMRDAVAGLVRVMVVGAAGITALTLLLEAGDVFAVWVLDRATEGQFNPALVLTGGTLGAGLMFILGLLAIITGVIQIGLLLVRSTLIVVLAGFWPVAAAGSMTPAGAQTWKKLTGWLLAFVLYKPVAAICYAAAFRLLGGGAGAAAAPSLLSTIEGMLLLALAIVALPAMLRLVVPAVSAIGGMSTAGVVAGGAAVATGAVALAGGGVLGGAAAGGASGAGGGIFAGGGSNGSNGGGSAAPGAVGGGPPDSPPGSVGPSGAGRRGSGGPSGSPGHVGSGGGTGPGAAGAGPPVPPGAAGGSGASGGSSDSGGISSGASRTGSGVSATGAVASGSAGVDRGVQNLIEERDDG
jgi:type IV secretion system protein TrbL